MTSTKLFLTLALLAGCASTTWAADCDPEVLGSKIASLLQGAFGSQGHIPLTLDQLNQDCQKAQPLLGEIVAVLKPCVPPFVAQVLPEVLSGVQDFLNAICTAGALQSQYLKVAQCLNQNMAAAKPCGERLLAYLPAIVKTGMATKACCPLAQFNFCVEEAAQKTCGKDADDFFQQMVSLLEDSDAFHYLCGAADCTGWLTDAPQNVESVSIPSNY